MLFLTREAFFKFSIEDLLVGEDDSRESFGSLFSRDGDAGSRSFQNNRGEATLVLLKGEEPAGEDSCLKRPPCRCQLRLILTGGRWLTLDCGKLGEFLRIAIGLNSESGRPVVVTLLGDAPWLPLLYRKGGIY